MTRAKPLNLNQMADDLGISRTKLKRCMSKGCPYARRGKTYEFDAVAVREWYAEDQAPGRKLAPMLHPDDPRHRERTAAAAIARIDSKLQRGNAVLRADGLARYTREVMELRSALLQVPTRMGTESADSAAGVEAALLPAIEDVLAALKADNPASWPNPRPAPEDHSWLDDVADGRDVLPLLAPGDPRYDFALAQAEKRELHLEELQASVLALPDALATLAEFNDRTRKRLRAVPGLVWLALAECGNSPDQVDNAIDDAINDALADLSGIVPEQSASVEVDLSYV